MYVFNFGWDILKREINFDVVSQLHQELQFIVEFVERNDPRLI